MWLQQAQCAGRGVGLQPVVHVILTRCAPPPYLLLQVLGSSRTTYHYYMPEYRVR